MRAGKTWTVTFQLIAAATGTPTAALLHNGVVDGSVTCTVTSGSATGQYKVVAAIPATGYAVDDTIEISVTATVAGVTGSNIVARTYITPTLVLASGTVLGSPTPTSSTFSISGLPTGAKTGMYNGKNVMFQTGTAANVGTEYPTSVTAGFTVVTAGSRADVVLATGTTMNTVPVAGDTMIFTV